jgi:hypothetical protein
VYARLPFRDVKSLSGGLIVFDRQRNKYPEGLSIIRDNERFSALFNCMQYILPSFSDGDGIDDLTARLSADTSVLRAAYAALGPQVSNQLFFQYSSRLTIRLDPGRQDGIKLYWNSRWW